jgi:hypothetical protein
MGVLVGWAAAIDSGRLFDTWGFLSDTESETGNVITAGTLRPPTNLCVSGNTCTASDTTVHLAWSLGSGVTPAGQRVMRATGSCPGSGLPGGAAQVGSNLAASATSFDDTTVAASTTYCYYIESFLQNWTAHSNAAQATTQAAFSARKLLLHTSNSMTTSAVTAGTVTISTGGGSYFWQYNPGVASTLSTTGWSLDLALDKPTQSGNVTSILITVNNTSCTGTVAATLVNVTYNLPKVSATTGVQIPLSPSAGSIAAGQVLCLTLTDNDNGSGSPHDIVVRTDTNSTQPVAGIKSALNIRIAP